MRTVIRAMLVSILLVAATTVAHAQEGDLAVTKSGPGEAAADTDVTYTIDVSNLGPDEMQGVSVIDQTPGGMTFVSVTGTPPLSCSEAGGMISCGVATLAAGETVSFSATFHIDPSVAPGTFITNFATASSQTPDLNDENNTGVATTQVPPPPQTDLVLTKTSANSAGPDTDVTFTVTLYNSSVAAENVELTDVLPGDMTLVSATQLSGASLSCVTPAVGSGGTITCTTPTFPAGESAVFEFVFHIPAGANSGTEYTNTATVTASNDPNEDNNTASTTVIVSDVDLSITKSGPPTALAGDDITYTIVATNVSQETALNVTIYDVLPPNTTFVSITQNNGQTFTCSTPAPQTNDPVLCTIGAFSPGSAEFTLIVRAGDTTSVTNSVTVGTASFDRDASNNSDSVTTTITPQADLAVTKSGPATIVAGSNITYTITAVNNGASTAASVSLVDSLPAGTTLVSLGQTSGPTFSCDSGTLTCTSASFAPNATATFSLVASVPASTLSGTVLTNTASISTTTADSDSSNDNASVDTTVTASANLSLTKSGPASVLAGAKLTYGLTLNNTGPSDAQTVSLSDAIPAGTTLVSLTQTSGPAFTCDSGTVTCTIASFAPLVPATFSVVVSVPLSTPNGTILTNTATVTTSTSDPDPSNNQSSVNTTVTNSAGLSLTKTGPASVLAGANITYGLTLSNAGPSDAQTVSLSDAIPAGTTLVSLTQTSGPAFICDDGTVTCTAASFAPLVPVTFSVVVSVPLSTPNGTILTNTATVITSTSDPDPSDNQSSVNTTVTNSADLSLTKTGPTSVLAGANITYVLTLANAGPSDAQTVSLADAIPAGTTLVSLTQTSGPAFTCDSGTVTCTTASFAPLVPATFSVVVSVPLSTPNGTILTNTATVTTTPTADPDPSNNASSVNTTVTNSADLSLTKSGPAGAIAGTNISYGLTLTNAGPSDAQTVSLSDAIPAGTTFVSFTQNSGPVFSCATPVTGGTGSVTCTIASLATATTSTFTLVVALSDAIPDGTSIDNTATVSTTTFDPDTANNSASSSATAGVSADLRVEKSGPATVNGGTPVTYTVTLTNLGPSDATTVTLTDVVPAGTTFSSATQNSGPPFTCVTPAVGSEGTIECSIAAFATSATAEFTFVFDVDTFTIGSVANTATVTATSTDPDLTNNSSTVVTPVIASPEIPALSPLTLALLALGCAMAGLIALKR